MTDLAKVLLVYSEEYAAMAEVEYPGMTVQAYMRGRLMNELDLAIKEAIIYAETNGGI
jgi:hypothetical protein